MRAPWPTITGVLVRRWPYEARDTREIRVMMEAETGVPLPQARHVWGSQRLEEAGKIHASCRKDSEGKPPGVSPPWYETSSLQNYKKISFCFLALSVCGPSLWWQPLEINTYDMLHWLIFLNVKLTCIPGIHPILSRDVILSLSLSYFVGLELL